MWSCSEAQTSLGKVRAPHVSRDRTGEKMKMMTVMKIIMVMVLVILVLRNYFYCHVI